AEGGPVHDRMPAVAATTLAAVGAAHLIGLKHGDLRGDHRLLHAAEQALGLGQRQAEPLRLQRAPLQRGDLVDDGDGVGLGLAEVIRETMRLWRQHYLSYDQSKYVVEQVRRRIGLAAPTNRPRTVERLDRAEVQRLIDHAYRDGSHRGLMIKTLFLTGARVSEFVHIRVEDLHLDSDPPQIHLTHAKGQACRYVPILPALAHELRTHLQGRR